ncbi:hypothetical protein B0H14DRAFT_2632745 [Mycena olivaceomarginata]|nr:hypothetical protein B0H14DRAFT_2632745 [Mycena olivaceomarginata]
MTPAHPDSCRPMPSTPCPNQVGDMRWLMRLILGSGGPGYPRISPITGRYVGASGDMSHSSHLLLTAMSPKLRTHAPTLDDILMEEDASDNAEGTPSWSQYIDDQAQDDTDSEMYDSGEDDDDEGMEAQIRLIPPAQDMDVDEEEEEEEEEETLLGSSNSELASELFPPDIDSDPEEEEQHLPPPSSLTQVAARIRDHVSKYLDDQAEDSDEEAEEEHEGDEQETKEDRDFVDDTAVHDDFVHRLPSNKDDAGEVAKRDVAREAAGGSGYAPGDAQPSGSLFLYNRAKHLRTGLQISKFERQRHLEMLENVRRQVHTWVRAPKAFDCRVGFVLAVTDLAVIQDGRCKVRKQSFPMSQRWFPRVDPTFAHIALFRGVPIVRLGATHPRQALSRSRRWGSRCGGDRGVAGFGRHDRAPNERVSMARVITPDNKTIYVGATGRWNKSMAVSSQSVPNNSEVVGATLPSTMSNGNKFSSSALSMLLVNGPSGLPIAFIQSSLLDGDFDDRWTDMATKMPFAGWSQGTATTDQPVSSALSFSSPDKSQRGFQGIEVMATLTWHTGFIVIPHKGFIGIIIGDFDSQERSDRLKSGTWILWRRPRGEPRQGSRITRVRVAREAPQTRGADLHALRDPDIAGIMVTIRGDHSLGRRVPIEHDDETLGGGPLFSDDILYGTRELEPPSNPRRSPIEAPPAATPKKNQLLRASTTPPRRMRRYGLAVAAPARRRGHRLMLWPARARVQTARRASDRHRDFEVKKHPPLCEIVGT